ncbi:MAG: hypothetical protein KAX28_11945 [Candidatus Marinimicrobia bacterium]|nr:hypothetical protein [Candidatus Neomarinimicrobiota bacterium]
MSSVLACTFVEEVRFLQDGLKSTTIGVQPRVGIPVILPTTFGLLSNTTTSPWVVLCGFAPALKRPLVGWMSTMIGRPHPVDVQATSRTT